MYVFEWRDGSSKRRRTPGGAWLSSVWAQSHKSLQDKAPISCHAASGDKICLGIRDVFRKPLLQYLIREKGGVCLY